MRKVEIKLIGKTYRNILIRFLAATLVLTLIAASGTTILGVVPTNGGFVGGTTIIVDNSPGDQTEPSVSGNLASYTDAITLNRVRFYDFLNPANSGEVPGVPGTLDIGSDVNGTRISFARQHSPSPFSFSVMVFDRTTSSMTEIAPGSNLRGVFATALGGDTVAFVNHLGPGGPDILLVGSVSNPTMPLVELGTPTSRDFLPGVSPAGTAVVWERCNNVGNC